MKEGRRAAEADLDSPLPVPSAISKPGASRRDKNRVTYIDRWTVRKPFCVKVGCRPKGESKTAILVVSCKQPVYLPWMKKGEYVWAKNHTVKIDGKEVVRKEGEPVENNLFRSWWELREAQPHLFEQGVAVAGQQACNQDEAICFVESELLTEEHVQCIHVQDMLGSAATEAIREHAFKTGNPRSTIGMHQTSRLQVTDVRRSKRGKQGAQAWKREKNRMKSSRARKEGVATHLINSNAEILQCAISMRQSIVTDDIENEGVVKAFRETAYLLQVGDADTGKLRMADGPEWAGTAGSSMEEEEETKH